MDLIQQGLQHKNIRFEDNGKYIVYSAQEKRRNFENPEEKVQTEAFLSLVHIYKYPENRIRQFTPIQMGSQTKEADIIVYTDTTKETPKIIVECKKPKRKDGIEQLKSYMNAKGAPVAVWSNGSDSIILYRPYPKEFNDKPGSECE